MAWFGQASEHDADHGEANEGGDGAGVALEVARQSAVSADPGEGALDDPAFGQNDEAMGVAALDDFQGPASRFGDGFCQLRALVSAIADDAFDEREGTPRPAQQIAGAVAILQIGRMDGDAQQEAEGIDQDVPLAPRDLLARIEALRVERATPF